MRKLILSLTAFTGLVVLAGFAGVVFVDYQRFLQTPLAIPETGFEYEVAPGAGVKTIAQDLKRRHILRQPHYLVLLARIEGNSAAIKAGEYRFTPGTTPLQLLNQLVAGKVREYSFTIIEGWTFPQLVEALARHDKLTHTLQGLSPEQIMAQLGKPDEHPEGRFLPDTYHFPKGASDLALLRRAYQAMETRLDREWQARSEATPLRTPYEALILASIIEKETGAAHERAEIAGVFTRRLNIGMPLQTDPTVIYGMGASFDGNLRRGDLTQDQPYNTYTRTGLPPTPIALPGAQAIHAALHPAPGNTLYFVARGDGTHEFSATLEQHNAAVTRYQLKGRRPGA
ncbi:MAG: endolytic transglycosylase MltG [Gammaproteobacteria bacterium]|nr:MAG: endolytic transglycosylase MltG [Gammaproteobacteria bacterium]